MGVIEAELQKLVKSGLNGVRVFHTLYRCQVVPLAERVRPMWMYDGLTDPDRTSSEDLSDDEVWSRIGRVLQLRPKERVEGRPIPFNCSIVSCLVCSLLQSTHFSLLFLFLDWGSYVP